MICKHLHCVYSLPWLDVVHIWLGYAVFYDDTGAFGHLGCTTNIYDVNMLPAVKITKHTVTKRCGGIVTPRRLAAKLSVTEAIAIKVTKCDHQQPLVGKSVVSDIANVNCCDENTSDLPDYHHCFERDHHDPLNDHNCFQDCCFIAIGRANVKVHTHSLGLAQGFFKNCVVKVRLGEDLDLLVGLSRSGHVHLHNIQTNGWIVTDATLLPSFVFLRWLSSMVQI